MIFFTYLYKFILSLFNPAERIKFKMDLFMAREIKRNRYHKFYQPSTKEATPIMGYFFYDIYKCVRAYQRTLLKVEKSQVLKDIIFQRYLDVPAQEILASISEEYIKKEAETLSFEELSKNINTNITQVETYFNETWCMQPDTCYRSIIELSWFVTYDYTGVLLRFAGKEITDTAVNIELNRVKSAGLSEQLKDFLAVAGIIEKNSVWEEVFAVLKLYNDAFPDSESWIKLFPHLAKVIKSDILMLIIRHTDANPDWILESLPYAKPFAAEHLRTYIEKARETLFGVERSVKSSMIEQLTNRVFPDTIPTGAKYYNDAENEVYIQSGYGSFSRTKQFNCLLSFFYIYSESIRELTNIILIKGSWMSREYSGEFSKFMHTVNDRFQELAEFDRSLSEQGDRGIKLRTYCSKASIGKRHGEYLRKYLDTINVEAHDVIEKTMATITMLQQQLQSLDTDRLNRQQNLMRNWTELEFMLKDTMPLSECVRKLTDLIALVHYVDSITFEVEN
ncbi:MAG: DUF5312 family protein [Spirochaetaceae bacterium]|jgi:hypothetical protein|nr:DUF5312 family protein [Spirochaetaceae bacterium]